MHEVISATIGQMLYRAAELWGDREAIVSEGKRLTYKDLLAESGLRAQRFLAAGIGHGTHVAVLTADHPEALLCFYGLWRIGAVVMPVCSGYGLSELQYCADAADAEYLLIDHAFKDHVFPEICTGLTRPVKEHILTMAEEPGYDYPCLSAFPPVGIEALSAAEALVVPEDWDTILFTSGSTGSSKPVVTTHFSRVNTMRVQASSLLADERDIYCSVLPMFHCFSITAVLLAAMSVGASVVYPRDRRSETILRTIETERCTILTAVPTLFSALLRRQKELNADVSSLRTGMIGGSTYKSEFFKRICNELGMDLLPSIGQTEGSAGITTGYFSDSLEVRATTLGKAFPGLEICIKDREGNTVLPGVLGEICFRGYNAMQGYYKMPEATAKAIDADGWVHMGDLGTIGDNGYLRYAGRIKDLVIRGGENVSPGEIEAVLIEDPRIEDVKIVGVPDPHYIEEICACIVIREGQELSAEEVRNEVRKKLSEYKVPRYVYFTNSLPLNNVGKIDRVTLKQRATDYFGL